MANGEWKPRKLDELGFLGRGKSRHRPRNDASLYGGSYPFIQTADVMAADPYITSYSQTYSELGFQQSKMWPPGTLCMTIAGANTAKTAILKIEACFPDSIVGFIPDKSKSDLHFIKYSLDLMRNRFLSVSRGATQDNLGLDKILSFPIFAPDVEVQRRIGAILSAYDELMENSQRRIRILEAMARALYREWFVHFRFPGHETHSRVPSPLGHIPKGWDAAPLDSLSLAAPANAGEEHLARPPTPPTANTPHCAPTIPPAKLTSPPHQVQHLQPGATQHRRCSFCQVCARWCTRARRGSSATASPCCSLLRC
jgi:type I restriction enzyme S subunit